MNIEIKKSIKPINYFYAINLLETRLKDLHENNLMGICIPKKYGGRDADLKTYMLAASEIGRYCGATALTFNMHVSSCLATGYLADNLEMDDEKRNEHNNLRGMHYERILKKGSIYAQPFSEGNSSAAGKSAFGTTALRTDKGWIINGKKITSSKKKRLKIKKLSKKMNQKITIIGKINRNNKKNILLIDNKPKIIRNIQGYSHKF